MLFKVKTNNQIIFCIMIYKKSPVVVILQQEILFMKNYGDIYHENLREVNISYIIFRQSLCCNICCFYP